MYIITFYSFKGGVGRTMALVNTAAELARRGRKVLLVDFDLEAPGLSTYDLLRPAKPHPGIVEFVTEYRNTRHAPLVRSFIYEAKPVGEKGGKLWVMPAGRGNAEYRRMLNALSWRTLYQDEEGFLLFEDTRLQWEAELHPDYVLIDARTGHTDIEGICTRQLADAVVVVFYPNEQNLAGLHEVCHHIRAEDRSGLKKKIKLHYVASNVADLDDEDRHLDRHLSQFRAMLGIPHAPIPILHRNETHRMLDQPVFVLRRPHSRLAKEYCSLVDALQIKNLQDRQGALLFLSEIQKEQSGLIDCSDFYGDFYGNGSERASRQGSQNENTSPHQPKRPVPYSISHHMNRIAHEFWDDAEVLFRVGQCFVRHKQPDMALTPFNRALALQPDLAEALFERAFCHRQLRDDTAAVEDLLHYLRDHGTQVSERKAPPETDLGELIAYIEGRGDFPVIDKDEEERVFLENEKSRLGREKNDSALKALLSISVEAFQRALELPAVRVASWGSCDPSSHDPSFWLHTAAQYLLRQRRWKDAIRYLETTVKDRIALTKNQRVRPASNSASMEPDVKDQAMVIGNVRRVEPDLSSFQIFYMAMAHWGQSGQFRRDLCSQCLALLQPFVAAEIDSLGAGWFQRLAYLLWGAGGVNEAAKAIDQALTRLDEDDHIDDDLSFWTFQETTPREFRCDCEEMRRMTRGEPVRPAFLGPPL